MQAIWTLVTGATPTDQNPDHDGHNRPKENNQAVGSYKNIDQSLFVARWHFIKTVSHSTSF